MNRRTVLKAIAATPLAMAADAPPVQAATPKKPAWLEWEHRSSLYHLMHVQVAPQEVALLPLEERRELAKQCGFAVERLPPQWALKDWTVLAEKFHAALGRVDRPDYSRDILLIPIDDTHSWIDRSERTGILRGPLVSTHDAFEWPKDLHGLDPVIVVGAVFLEALYLRTAQLRIRNGVAPSLENVRMFSIHVPVS